MPALSQEEKHLLGSPVLPFERVPENKKNDSRKRILDGESDRTAFESFIHDGIDNGKPEHKYTELTQDDIEIHIKTSGRLQEKSFLWILDETSIKIIREKTSNPGRTHNSECVCHSNLTGCEKAYAGGEMFFGEDGRIYVNSFSDRYGHLNSIQWKTVIDYFKRVFTDYEEVVDILELLKGQTQ